MERIRNWSEIFQVEKVEREKKIETVHYDEHKDPANCLRAMKPKCVCQNCARAHERAPEYVWALKRIPVARTILFTSIHYRAHI